MHPSCLPLVDLRAPPLWAGVRLNSPYEQQDAQYGVRHARPQCADHSPSLRPQFACAGPSPPAPVRPRPCSFSFPSLYRRASLGRVYLATLRAPSPPSPPSNALRRHAHGRMCAPVHTRSHAPPHPAQRPVPYPPRAPPDCAGCHTHSSSHPPHRAPRSPFRASHRPCRPSCKFARCHPDRPPHRRADHRLPILPHLLVPCPYRHQRHRDYLAHRSRHPFKSCRLRPSVPHSLPHASSRSHHPPPLRGSDRASAQSHSSPFVPRRGSVAPALASLPPPVGPSVSPLHGYICNNHYGLHISYHLLPRTSSCVPLMRHPSGSPAPTRVLCCGHAARLSARLRAHAQFGACAAMHPPASSLSRAQHARRACHHRAGRRPCACIPSRAVRHAHYFLRFGWSAPKMAAKRSYASSFPSAASSHMGVSIASGSRR